MKKGVSIFVDADGKSIDALARMIQLRGEHLGETSKDATVAAVIDVLLSLRASTRSAVKRQRFPGVKIRRRADLRPSWRGYAQRCLRMGESVFTPPNNMAVVWHEVKGFKDRDLKVFEVVPEHENNRPYFVVTAGEKAAKECEKKRALRRVKNYGGIARRALGHAMAKCSTRNVSDPAGMKADVKASQLAFVEVMNYGAHYAVEVRDTLDYATLALKGGRGDVNLAIQKAANKIAGQIKQHLKKVGDFKTQVSTPFPGIRRGSK
jgi:hypothetical protein